MQKRCVECGGFVPIFLQYFCEECCAKMWNEHLEQKEARKRQKKPP